MGGILKGRGGRIMRYSDDIIEEVRSKNDKREAPILGFALFITRKRRLFP